MKHVIYILIVVFLFAAAGMAQTKTDSAQGMLVTTDWVAAHGKDAGVVILHVGMDRTAYDAGHITGARFLGWSDITTTRNNVPNQLPVADVLKTAFERAGVGDRSHVVIYGDTPLLASYTYFALDYLGQAKHAVLDGGLEKWKADKRPVGTARPTVAPAKLTVEAHPGLLVDFAAVQKIAAEKKVPVIDGRPPEQYSGVTPGDGIKRGGHIPGARSIPWGKACNDDGTFKSADDLRSLYGTEGIDGGKPVIAYCRIGERSSHTWFVLKYLLGFDKVTNYDGSWTEWGNLVGAAVERGAAVTAKA